MEKSATVIALAGKGGVGKTSLSAAIVKLLTEAYPNRRILAIDADPAVGLATALGIGIPMTVDDIRREIVSAAAAGQNRAAIELLGDARYRIMDALLETDADYSEIGKIAGKSHAVTETLNHARNQVSFDCDTCRLKPVCDEIDGMKALHFSNRNR